MSAKWVQHISGQGKKWELIDNQWNQGHTSTWECRNIRPHLSNLFLPQGEYHICDPPEIWKDVTEQCYVDEHNGQIYHRQNSSFAQGLTTHSSLTSFGIMDGYRLRKVQLETPHKCGKELSSTVWAFIVERRKP